MNWSSTRRLPDWVNGLAIRLLVGPGASVNLTLFLDVFTSKMRLQSSPELHLKSDKGPGFWSHFGEGFV